MYMHIYIDNFLPPNDSIELSILLMRYESFTTPVFSITMKNYLSISPTHYTNFSSVACSTIFTLMMFNLS